MPMGTRHHLTGLLLRSAQGYSLQIDGGGAYALDVSPLGRKLVGTRVTAEGTRSGFDRIDVDRIEPASVNSAS